MVTVVKAKEPTIPIAAPGNCGGGCGHCCVH
jgi:hypothetical protein